MQYVISFSASSIKIQQINILKKNHFSNVFFVRSAKNRVTTKLHQDRTKRKKKRQDRPRIILFGSEKTRITIMQLYPLQYI